MEVRQIINNGRKSATTTSATRSHCTPFALPSNGILSLGPSYALTLTSDAVFEPQCTAGADDIILTGSSSLSYADFRDPFYASTIPECYALAATTVIAYMLVIMLFITPRTFLHEGAVVLGRRGFTNGPSGSDAGIGIGGRPWLQKVAALTVAISLTIATANTFRVAEMQYDQGIMDALALQNKVEGGTELKVIRVISDTFLWLAQAQTLIRLFPRQREKIIIKWSAFALITLHGLFSILNNFVYNGNSRPQTFVDAIPALAYLFKLALGLLYAAWVIYYSVTKKQFAYYHPQMKNIFLVALLSLVAVLVPVIFFVLDISKPTLAGWGDYVRWVGAAAASVVVWEWVERIEALERDDKKDGVLGREVFDGDDMLEVNPSPADATWTYRMKNKKGESRGKGDGDGDGSQTTGSNRTMWPGMAGLANRYRLKAGQDVEADGEATGQAKAKRLPRHRPPLWPTRPPVAATPVSRTDTASAESTVYAIRYHPISEPSPPPVSMLHNSRSPQLSRHNSLDIVIAESVHGGDEDSQSEEKGEKNLIEQNEDASEEPEPQNSSKWQNLAKANPFRRRAQDPPAEVSLQIPKAPEPVNIHDSMKKWDVKARLEDFAVTQAEKIREKNQQHEAPNMPITVIPAPPRRRNLQATLEDLEKAERGERNVGSETDNATTCVASVIPSQITRTPITNSHLSPCPPISPRPDDPYTPQDVNRTFIQQRGALSFLTTVPPQDVGGGSRSDIVSPVSLGSPLEGSRFSPLASSSRSKPMTPVSPIPRNHGMPLVNIPPPPRRRRQDDEEDQ